MAMTKKPAKAKAEALTIEQSMEDFKAAYRDKAPLLRREHADFLFALGEQWSKDDKVVLEQAGIKPIVDNRIAPNLFLLTGLERQNRADFQAFPVGDEDGTKAEIASALFKDAITKSGFGYKSSEQFKDGITCGESHLELYLDYTDDLINGKPCWKKCDGNALFPEPGFREYDFSDARYVYKLTLGISKGDLINLYPEQQAAIEAAGSGTLELTSLLEEGGEKHQQPRDYPKRQRSGSGREEPSRAGSFDLIERFYKKYVEKVFVGDKQTGQIKEAEDADKAQGFIDEYVAGIQRDQEAYDAAVHAQVVQAHGALNASRLAAPIAPPAAAAAPAGEQFGQPTAQDEATEPGEGAAAPAPVAPAALAAPVPPAPIPLTPEVHADIRAHLGANRQLPPPPPAQDPQRFIVIKRQVPEIWCYAHTPGMDEPLCDEVAWHYPKWKAYPFVPYFARFSTAPLRGDDRHLLIQGLVHGVKGVQEKHNKAEMLMIRHLNSATNSGWLSEEGSWVDPDQVKLFGTAAGVNLEYKKGSTAPERITPMQLSAGHAEISASSAEAIKAGLGINSDLLATQQGGADSGRAIALRQKQGLLMVQELFDNLSRSRQIAGRLLLSQLGEIYDTETAIEVLGESYLKETFPPLMLNDPANPQNPPAAMKGKDGQPMLYDKDMAELAITEVLSGTLGEYDVTVGESVSSETQKMAASAEVKDIASQFPGMVPPDILVKYAQLPESAKTEIISAIEKAEEAAQQAAAAHGAPAPIPARPTRPAPARNGRRAR